jgi:hypothetical protein
MTLCPQKTKKGKPRKKGLPLQKNLRKIQKSGAVPFKDTDSPILCKTVMFTMIS